MAITVTGGPNPLNIGNYTAEEDATPLDPASSTGGVGQVSWLSEAWPLVNRLKGTDVVLADNERGRLVATVRAVSTNGYTAQITADSELGKFNVVRQAMPYSGPIDGLFQYYLDLCGIFSPLDFQAPIFTIHAPGFYGNVWDNVKAVLSANQIEMALVADTVVVRKPRQFVATNAYQIEMETSVESQTSAVAIPINFYNNRQIVKGEVYPIRGETPSIQTVEANETIEFEIELNASVSKVYQPVMVESAGPANRSGTDGVYTIVGNDNLPIKPEQWSDSGGFLRVETTNDPSVIKVVVKGAGIPHLSPFRIAESAGDRDFNSLHITGDGVAWSVGTMLLYTGADPLQTSEEMGTTVDNRFLSTPSQAWFAAQRTAAALSGSDVKIRGTVTTINRNTNDKQPVYAQLRDADRVHAAEGILTMAQFDAEYTDQTLQDFDEKWRDMYVDAFQNQVYGNVNGARVKHGDAFYRIESATVTPDTINFSGSIDTSIADFDSVWGGKTMAEFDEAWADASLDNFSMMPLWEGNDDNP